VLEYLHVLANPPYTTICSLTAAEGSFHRSKLNFALTSVMYAQAKHTSEHRERLSDYAEMFMCESRLECLLASCGRTQGCIRF
jgi:hypothetical protein